MTSIIFFFIFVPILSVILLSVNFIFAPHKPYKEKKTPFECGYHSFLSQNRTQFTISFFIFALLFLIFDLEIVLIYPYSVSSYANNIYGLVTMIIFTLVLTVGFIFELGKNALKIESKQNLAYNDKLETGKNNIKLFPLEANLGNNVYIISTISFILVIVNKKLLISYLDALGLSIFIPIVVILFILISLKLNSYIRGNDLNFKNYHYIFALGMGILSYFFILFGLDIIYSIYIYILSTNFYPPESFKLIMPNKLLVLISKLRLHMLEKYNFISYMSNTNNTSGEVPSSEVMRISNIVEPDDLNYRDLGFMLKREREALIRIRLSMGDDNNYVTLSHLGWNWATKTKEITKLYQFLDKYASQHPRAFRQAYRYPFPNSRLSEGYTDAIAQRPDRISVTDALINGLIRNR
jgi:NADH-ubiquinone oxidoreductase chain 3